MSTLRLEIVTPERRAYSGEVEMVSLPCVDGEMTVYPMHMPVVAQLGAGEVVIQAKGAARSFAVAEGFVKIIGTEVSILTDMAIDAEHIDQAAAEDARRRAEARLQEKLTEEELAVVNASLVHALTQLHVKRRRQK